MSLDSVLNAVIPWVIGIAGVWIMYKPLSEPLLLNVQFSATSFAVFAIVCVKRKGSRP